ncbi:hypothetical protein GGG16DRAFT_35711, partial [Schizophyllum commune]
DPIFPNLLALTLEFADNQNASDSDIEQVLLPFLSQSLKFLEVVGPGNEPIRLLGVYPEIAERVSELEALSLPNSASTGICNTYFRNLRLLTFKDLRSEDATALESLSDLEYLRIAYQINTLPHQYRIKEGSFAKLGEIDLMANHTDVLESLLLTLPPFMAAQSCAIRLANIGNDWPRIFKQLKPSFRRGRLQKLRIRFHAIANEFLNLALEQWNQKELLGCHLLYLSAFRFLSVIEFNASAIPGFVVNVNDADIERLASNCPALVRLTLGGGTQQTTSKITLKALYHL